MDIHYQHLDFPTILNQLSEQAFSARAKDLLTALEPIIDEALCQRAMQETTDARRMLDTCGAPPLALMDKLEESVHLAQAGGRLEIDALEEAARFCTSCRRLSAYLAKATGNALSAYAHAFEPLDDLQIAIEDAILHGALRDDASPALKRLRHALLDVESRIKEKLDHLLRTHKERLSDNYFAQRGGHYVLPVKKVYQKQFPGTVVDASRTGGTVFMEPSAIAHLQAEWDALSVEEELECQRILYVLSDQVAERASAILSNAARMTELDMLFAKARLSQQMNASPIAIDCERSLTLIAARHPLLDRESCVPLDLHTEGDCHGIVITGPNTGGKTVALKTVGLLTLMAQCGLHVPCAPGSHLPMRDRIFCDIGDSQSLTANLSTFSGHMGNILGILSHLTSDSLVLLDELGSGTDPTEGMGIAIAILESLRLSGCFFLVTTHYPEVKTYVQKAAGLMSARMAFDRESLRPLYRLEMGKTGQSCALEIVRRLGMPEPLLHAAQHVVANGLDALPALVCPVRHGKLKHKPLPRPQAVSTYQLGDSVLVLPEKEHGLVYRPADDQGQVVVQIKGEKRTIRHTRLQLLIPAKELYPEDYDFSIVFDTVANRKARHTLNRRYDADATIVYEKGE